MDSQLEIKLIECLSQLEGGEPLDSILARYPNDAASLRPLLETATALDALREEPSEVARIASRRAFLSRAHELSESAARRPAWLPRRLTTSIAALVIAVIFMGGTVAASAVALPDEPLYGVKRAVEDTRLLVASGAQKQQLLTDFEQRRRDEVNILLAMRRDAAIAFEGTIEAMQPDGLDVSGLYLHVDRTTTITGTPVVGGRAHVQGRTQSGQLFATSVIVEPGSGPPVISTAMPTATPPPSVTPSPSPSARPSPSAEATQQPEHTSTPAAGPIAAPTRALSATPRPPATALPPTSAPAAPAPPTPIPPTPIPPTPEEEIEFSGTVEATGAIWVVSGTRVETDGGTEIRGTIGVGDSVKVRARRLADGRLIAKRIERVDDSVDNSGNTNTGVDDKGNDNSGTSGGVDNKGNDNSGSHGGDDSGSDSGGSHGGGDGGGGSSGDDKP